MGSVVAGAGRNPSLNHASNKSVERAARAEVERKKSDRSFFSPIGNDAHFRLPPAPDATLYTHHLFSPFYTCDHADEMEDHSHSVDVITIDSDDDDLEVTRPAPTRGMDLFV